MINTGQSVLTEEGGLPACTKRQKLCGYACCKFTAGNWILLLPGEYQQAIQQSLQSAHLSFDSSYTEAVCHKPCQKGEFKPLDCSWYPLFPANQTATKFLVADHRKCPIPNHELIAKMLSVQTSALAWELKHAGSLAKIAQLSRGFVGYLPFPYKIENGLVQDMSEQEIQDLALAQQLPADYVCREWTIEQQGYTASTTPDDMVVTRFYDHG
jgi:Fe-S-cluster containining protein